MKFWIFVLLVSVCRGAWGNVLVLEYEVPEDDHLHGASVEWIACQNAMSTCTLQYAPDFSTPEFFESLTSNLESSHIVNMSFTVQKPESFDGGRYYHRGSAQDNAQKRHKEATATFEKDSKIISGIVTRNPDKLFIAAAGNGVPIGPFMSSGVALELDHHLYPQVLEQPNLIKVAALNVESFDLNNPGAYEIADYSNHGLFYVELAAPVEANHHGEIINGSSFAAPYVARITEEIRKYHEELNPHELRKILIRSCHIKDLNQALWATEDLLNNGTDSIVYKAMTLANKEKRMKLRSEVIPNVTLVQCAGAFSRQLSLICAENYVRGTYKNVDQACLAAHKELTSLNSADQERLQKLWTLRFNEGSFAQKVISQK